MGHKVHPYGFRLGVSRTWNAKWYAGKGYAALLQEDIAIRQLITRRLANASVSGVEVERGINHVTVTIHTAKPGIVIGKGGANVEALRQQIGRLTTRKVKLEIKEIRQPELDAILVAANIAQQLSRRIAFKKAMKQAVQRTMKAGAKGVKVNVASRQIEAARRAMTRYVKRGGKIWIRIFPDKPVTKKPAEVRMGSGKGAPDHWVAVVKPGRILFEMAGVPLEEATEAMRLASHKLPLGVKFVAKEGVADGHR